MKYIATFTGREKNAIGLFYQITASVEANNPEEANLRLYYKYDHISQLTLANNPDNKNLFREHYGEHTKRFTELWYDDNCYHITFTDWQTRQGGSTTAPTYKEAMVLVDRFLSNEPYIFDSQTGIRLT